MKIFTAQERNVVIILSMLLIFGVAVNFLKKQFYSSGTDSLTYIGKDTEIVDYYARLDKSELTAGMRININSAILEDFMMLPGIGEITAGKILAKRDELGTFQNLEDILLVPGIGSKKFE